MLPCFAASIQAVDIFTGPPPCSHFVLPCLVSPLPIARDNHLPTKEIPISPEMTLHSSTDSLSMKYPTLLLLASLAASNSVFADPIATFEFTDNSLAPTLESFATANGISVSDLTVSNVGDPFDGDATQDFLRISGDDTTEIFSGSAVSAAQWLTFSVTIPDTVVIDLTELSVDLEIAGSDPYTLARVYSSIDGFDDITGDTIVQFGLNAVGTWGPGTQTMDLATLTPANLGANNTGAGSNVQIGDFRGLTDTTITFWLPWVDNTVLTTNFADLDNLTIGGIVTIDPTFDEDAANGGPDLDLGFWVGNAEPITAPTRTVRYVNNGFSEDITVNSVTIEDDFSGVFSVSDLGENGVGGQSTPIVLSPGESIEITVAASGSAGDHFAFVVIDTDADEWDTTLPVAVSLFLGSESLVLDFEGETPSDSSPPDGWSLVGVAGAPTYATTANGEGSDGTGGSTGLGGQATSNDFGDDWLPGAALVSDAGLDLGSPISGSFDFMIVNDGTFDDVSFTLGDIANGWDDSSEGELLNVKLSEINDGFANGLTNGLGRQGWLQTNGTFLADDTWYTARFSWVPFSGLTGDFSITVSDFSGDLFTLSTAGFTFDSANGQFGFGSVNDVIRIDNVNFAGSPPPSSAYAAWETSNSVTQGFDGDDDLDGVANGFEWYFFDSDPLVFEGLGSPLGGTAKTGPDTFSFTHRRPVDRTGVTELYEWTTDLTGPWTESGQSDGAQTVTLDAVGAGDDGSGYEDVTVTATITGSTPARLFTRLSLSHP